MTINNAVAIRILTLLNQKGISKYKLEKISGIPHGSMARILLGKNKTVTITTIYKISSAFNISIIEFLFKKDNIEYDK